MVLELNHGQRITFEYIEFLEISKADIVNETDAFNRYATLIDRGVLKQYTHALAFDLPYIVHIHTVYNEHFSYYGEHYATLEEAKERKHELNENYSK